MSLVSFSNVTVEFLWENILENVSFTIDENSRIGLIGRNGSGKTTIFNLIAQNLSATSGEVQIAKNRKIGYMTQEPVLDESLDLYETVYRADDDIIRLKNQINDLEILLQTDNTEDNLLTLAHLHERMECLDAYNFELQLEMVLSNLNFPKELWHQKVRLFSGGEKSRIQLAKILLQPFDLLILDEPTNHLDIGMINWLEKYLIRLNKPFMIISHDRVFLDKTVNKIYEIINKGIFVTHGNYSAHKDRAEKMKLEQERHYKQQQKEISEIKDFIMRNMAGQKVQQAKSRLKKLEKMEIVEKPTEASFVKLRIESEKRSGEDVVILDDLRIGYPGHILAENVNLNIRYRDKVALMGKNGCGKTTLLKIINEELLPLSGKAKRGSALSIGYYDQLHMNLSSDLTVAETAKSIITDCTDNQLYSFLARYGFYQLDFDKKVGTLSGGEKARLFLAKLIYEKPNFLILDEPTNHLDLLMVDSLIEALNDYDGTILFISHDRYFIKSVASRLWYFTDKTIKEHLGDVEEIFVPKTQKKAEKVVEVKQKKKNRINPIVLEKKMGEIERLQQRIAEINSEICEKEARFADPSFYSNTDNVLNNKNEIELLKNVLAENETVLSELENEYLELAVEE
ncbi:MAG: ABC-F family ATP-binding cassette domain-containing protein [Candidatus Cloacimonetes bacterium]|nr:ABC-F family ATP-binding cassette domain-containing protein [Candidatus Cloacimonadota bacterium]